jgi:hypothetical protein
MYSASSKKSSTRSGRRTLKDTKMNHSRTRLLSFTAIAALISVFVLAPHGVVHVTFAAEQSLSDAQIKKIDGWIAGKGNNVIISAVITEILGLTEGDQTISSRAFAAVDPETGNEIHQIYLLPGLKGYLVDHFHQDKVEVYWTDKDFVLKAALAGVRGEKPGPTSFQEAQLVFRNEVAWWAKFADAN